MSAGGGVFENKLELHYDISGVNADEVEMKVWEQQEYSRSKIHSETGKTDGYFETNFIPGSDFYICFKSKDAEEKDVNFMFKQITTNKVEFAKMTHIEAVNHRMKNMQDDFDVISHNLQSRMNFDSDINERLISAKNT